MYYALSMAEWLMYLRQNKSSTNLFSLITFYNAVLNESFQTDNIKILPILKFTLRSDIYISPGCESLRSFFPFIIENEKWWIANEKHAIQCGSLIVFSLGRIIRKLGMWWNFMHVSQDNVSSINHFGLIIPQHYVIEKFEESNHSLIKFNLLISLHKLQW